MSESMNDRAIERGVSPNADLYIMVGLPYAGKTTLRNKMVKRFGFNVISIDEINDELGAGQGGKPIIQAEGDATYTEAYKRLKEYLSLGKKVIFDGANLPFLPSERNLTF